tara:strand:+ start:35 stop:265 length:231 start_codon:yes stop_codon:yes gene_type:complete
MFESSQAHHLNKKHRHFGGAFFVESLLWVGLDDRLEKLHMCIFNFDYDLPHVNARFFFDAFLGSEIRLRAATDCKD